MSKVNSFKAVLWLFVFLTLSTAVFSGTTGKIAGYVRDAETGDPLIGADIIVEGAGYLGASAGLEGDYVIVGVPPGRYTVVARFMGYQSVRQTDVLVSVDLTASLDFDLGIQVLEADEVVTVVAERPLVVRDLTASTANITAEELEAMPVESMGEVLELQAGVINGHVRGGRSGETLYMVDGIPVTDPYDGNLAVDIENESIQELQLITGAFNAEYGQAMSGVVNIVTKDGDDEFEWSASGYLGDHFSGNADVFRNIDAVNPFAQHNIQGTFSGPIIKGKLYAFATIRNFQAEGHMYGVRQYNIDDTFLDANDPRNGLGGDERWWLKGVYAEPYEESFMQYDSLWGTDRRYLRLEDSTVVPYEFYSPLTLDSLEAFKNNGYRLGTGDSSFVPMNPYEKQSYHLKLTYRVTPRLSLRLNFLQDSRYERGWEEVLQFNPDGNLHRYKDGGSITFNLNHQLTENSFYQLGYSRVQYEWLEYKFEDPFAFFFAIDTDGDGWPDEEREKPEGWVPGDLYLDQEDIELVSSLSTQQLYSYFTGGIYNNWFNRKTLSQVYKGDFTSQLNTIVELKGGLQARLDDVYRRFVAYDPQTGFPIWFDLNVNPMELSGYGQTKLEFKNLIVNAGLRVDYFDSDGHVPADPRDPYIYNPLKPDHKYYDLDDDGHIDDSEPYIDADSNGVWTADEEYTDADGDGKYDLSEKTDDNLLSYEDREAFWFEDASPKWQVSPRIGLGYPISDRGVIHVSYGHFFQIPKLEDLFTNPEYIMISGGGISTLFGNPDLEPQKTVSYEIGLQQELTDNFGIQVDFYFRDIRNLVSADKIVETYDQSKYAQFVNRDYANTRGVILSFDKRHSNLWSGSLDYTFQIAEGNASNPQAAYYARQGNAEPEIRLLRLDWDQRHSLNFNVTIGQLDSWGSSVTGQFGSGLPYTPSDEQGNLGVSIQNAGTKPTTFVVDWKVYKNLHLSGFKINVYAKVENLFDTLNEYDVNRDTGTATYTLAQLRAEQNEASEAINTLDEFFLHQGWYGEPRRFTMGFSIGMDK